jgi:hypothetical protein
MRNGLRKRFYPESIMGLLTAVAFVVTLLNRSWIETVFQVDPDRGSGSLEWMIVGGLLVATVVLFSLAGYEWRRAAATAA